MESIEMVVICDADGGSNGGDSDIWWDGRGG